MSARDDYPMLSDAATNGRAREERIVRATREYIRAYDPTGNQIEPLYDCEVATILASIDDE